MQIYSDKKFKNPLCIIKAFDTNSLEKAFELIDLYRKDYFLLGYVRYEAAEAFFGKQIKSDMPLCWFEVFDTFEPFEPDTSVSRQYLDVKPKISKELYFEVFEKIKNYIAEGYTYEVNYTYPCSVKSKCEPLELYNYLLSRQKTPYNAYIKNDYEEVLSFSPELFFRIENNKIITKPMKGTIPRGKNKFEDEKNIEFLKNDIKNRAENVMIVDLLRNDLGRIAKTGSVSTDKLFEIETHKTLHQMTSEISAELEDVSLFEVFKAIFPCGSITGAPKISTMKIIEALETERRDIYCGAIGFLSPDETVFSVPIRILQRRSDENAFTYNAGGAIVWDSAAQEEWDETITKRKFLEFETEFRILETMKAENGKILFEKEHFERMKKSALTFGYDLPQIASVTPEKDGMVRFLLSKDGSYELQYIPLSPAKTNIITISDVKQNSKELFLRHKTTFRPWYNESLKKIKENEIYDEIFFNERGELTEGARSNIIIQIGNRFYTPPVSCGLLNGIYRQKLLKEGKCEEKILFYDDLKNADKIFCVNSVRGMVEVYLDDTNR